MHMHDFCILQLLAPPLQLSTWPSLAGNVPLQAGLLQAKRLGACRSHWKYTQTTNKNVWIPKHSCGIILIMHTGPAAVLPLTWASSQHRRTGMVSTLLNNNNHSL
jgi:hypothetical protein